MARGTHLTIDEWFYHWFDDEESSLLITAFFEKLLEVCDKIVLQRGTRLAKKFYDLCESSIYYPPLSRRRVKFLMNSIISNINKVHWVDETEKFSAEIVNRLPRKDVYLVEMCSMTVDKILITTDRTLHQNITDLYKELGIIVLFAEDFIKAYPELSF